MAESSRHDASPNSSGDEIARLKRAVEELTFLNDLARSIGALTSSDRIMQTIVRKSLRAVHAEQGVVTLLQLSSEASTKTLIRAMVSSAHTPQFHFQQAILGWMLLNKKPLTVNDPVHDVRFQGISWDASIHSFLCVPLMVKSELKGVLTVYNKREGETFSEDDQRLLAIIAAQSAQVVENARLYEEEKELQRLQEEVRLAARIQRDLLPPKEPVVQGYELAAQMIPAQVCGGDYYDFIPLGDGRLAICLGDVSGKGLPASLLMANVQATLRGGSRSGTSPSECLQRSNQLLFRSTSPEKFVTLFYSILDPAVHTLSFCNAGHDRPFLIKRDGSVGRLAAGGIVLAALDDFPYQEETIRLEPGDLLVVYSDGIPEAWNADEHAFGEEGLEQAVREHRDGPLREVVDGVVGAVRKHAGSCPQSDDITIVTLRRISETTSQPSA